MKRTKSDCIEEIYRFANQQREELPLFAANISAGFPSPADDYIDKKLDLNELLIRHPAATFFVRVSGNSMIDAGINPGDILIVDRALEATDNRIVIAAVNGELTVKRIQRMRNTVSLIPENPAFAPIEVTPEMEFEVWGVVSHVIHQV